jgi:uncharacterized protein YjbI with pentapeptide repeats
MLTTKMIGHKIAEARKSINISQAQLAQQLFISSQAVGKWERGESMPDITTFIRLAEILGVDLNYFSESFNSAYSEVPSDEPFDKQSAETASLLSSAETLLDDKPFPSANQKNKLRWNMSYGNWVDADFSGLKNLHEKFSSSNMQRCKFIGSDLSGLLLKGNNIDSCDFSDSDLSSSHIQGSNIGKNIFKDSSLKETEFSGSNIDGCDFSGVNFSGAEFSKSYISGCDFTGADFTGVVMKSGGIQKNTLANVVMNHTSFNAMWIVDIVFEGTLEDCAFENCAFKKVIFQNATLINNFFKTKNRSLKGIRFIECKADRMTYEFLKAGKADLTGITLLTS